MVKPDAPELKVMPPTLTPSMSLLLVVLPLWKYSGTPPPGEPPDHPPVLQLLPELPTQVTWATAG